MGGHEYPYPSPLGGLYSMNSMGGSGRGGGFDIGVGGSESSSAARLHQQHPGWNHHRQKTYVTSVGPTDRFSVSEELLGGVLDGLDEKRPIVAAAASTAALLGAGTPSTHLNNTYHTHTLLAHPIMTPYGHTLSTLYVHTPY